MSIEVIRDDLVSGNYRLSHHAKQWMFQRGVSIQDIKICAEDSDIFADGEEFKIVGLDAKNEDLTIICAYYDGTLIVTVK